VLHQEGVHREDMKNHSTVVQKTVEESKQTKTSLNVERDKQAKQVELAKKAD